MKKLIFKLLLQSGALYFLATALNNHGITIKGDLQTFAGFKNIILLVLVMGFLNTFLMPVLKILSFPIRLLTLGAFTFVLNIIIVYLATYFLPSFKVQGITSALIFSLVYSLISLFVNMLVK